MHIVYLPPPSSVRETITIIAEFNHPCEGTRFWYIQESYQQVYGIREYIIIVEQ